MVALDYQRQATAAVRLAVGGVQTHGLVEITQGWLGAIGEQVRQPAR